MLPFLGYSQQPSHYKLGEEELEGVDIYGIHHASTKNYYLATSSGVIVYDGYTFKAVDCAETLMGSVFNLVEDYSGNIYCNNLSGQVFKVVDERCELFFTVPDSAASADIGLEVDNQNRILVRASKLLFLNQNAELDFSHWIGYTAFPTRMADSSIWVYSRSLKQFAVFKNGHAGFQRLNINEDLLLFAFGATTNIFKFFKHLSLLIYVGGAGKHSAPAREQSVY